MPARLNTCGGTPGVSPRAVGYAAVVAELLGDLRKRSFEAPDVDTDAGLMPNDLDLEIADLPSGQHRPPQPSTLNHDLFPVARPTLGGRTMHITISVASQHGPHRGDIQVMTRVNSAQN